MNATAASQESRGSPGMRPIALMVATVFFISQLDTTVLVTALPDISRSLGTSPLYANIVLTSYLVGITAFIPASGRIADKFGARNVFAGAVALFMFSSVLCALSTSIEMLVAARLLQGIGGAMMSPVGRLILLRTVPKSELVRAMAWVLTPAMIAPIVGPLLGGFFVTYFSWHWIFYLNLPIGLLGIVLAWIYVPDDIRQSDRPFDRLGAVYCGVALSGLIVGLELLVHGFIGVAGASLVLGIGIGATMLFLAHSRTHKAPVIDLGLLRIPTLAITTWAGLAFRIAIGAFPFLLPMMLQLGLGLSALSSGAITFASGVSALAVKLCTVPLLRRFGYRQTMVANSFLCAAFLAICGTFTLEWPLFALYAVVLLGGFVRSLQANALGTIFFADVPADRMSDATSLNSLLQQLASVLGISISAAILNASVGLRGAELPSLGDFTIAFLLMAAPALLSGFLCLRLAADAGHELSGSRARRNTSNERTADMTASADAGVAPGLPEGAELHPLFPRFGARISGRHGDAEWARAAVAAHGVLVFDPGAFTPATAQDFVHALGGDALGRLSDGLPFGDAWSIAGGYREDIPALGAILVEGAPPAPGGILFSNARLAFESIDPLLAAYLRELTVITYADSIGAFHRAYETEEAVAEQLAAFQAVETPLVGTHPLTGQEYLAVNETFTNYVRHVERVFSNNLLGIVFEHLKAPEATGFVRWEAGSLIVWDNRVVQHRIFHDPGEGAALLASTSLEQPRSLSHVA